MKSGQSLNINSDDHHKASFLDLFKYSKRIDIILMIVGGIGALVMGGIQPLFFYLIGSIYNEVDPQSAREDYYDSATNIAKYLIIFAAVFMVASYVAVTSWIFVGSRQGYYYRRELFNSIIHKDPRWYDENNVAELPGGLMSDSLKIERATGDKLILLIAMIAMILASFIMAIIVATQLTLICLAIGPLTLLGVYVMSAAMEESARKTDTSYKKAGGITEEALNEIKTVSAHNAQEYESNTYDKALEKTHAYMLKNGLKRGAGAGIAIGIFFVMFAIDFRLGAYLIDEGKQNWGDGTSIGAGDIMISILVVFIAFNNMGTLIPSFALISSARSSLYNIQSIIHSQSNLKQGDIRRELEGSIEFIDVRFSYPASLEKEVLNGVSFSLSSGERLGVVGATGSGKSTIVQLILRYYDPTRGKILIDGLDISQFNIQSLRQQLGLVSQEPLLFNTTILQNIRYGDLNATDEEIIEAAKKACAFDFIQDLPEKFKTEVGTKGSHLSGGQKQRIAVARAIIRNPKILLLDEATSALDRNTEMLVLNALSNSLPDSSWVMIAQNLRTLRYCSRIIVLENGRIVENGTHEELVRDGKQYYNLWKMQEVYKPDKEERDFEVLQELIIERGEQVEQDIQIRR